MTNFYANLYQALQAYPKWHLLANYCSLKDKGLRKPAFVKLGEFTQAFLAFDDDQKLSFVNFIYTFRHHQVNWGWVSYPLSDVLYQTLKSYCDGGSDDVHHYYWLGLYYYDDCQKYLNKALQINPNFYQARHRLIEIGLNDLWYATHHLPEYYVYDAGNNEHDDFLLCQKLKQDILALSDDKKDEYLSELHHYEQLIGNYIKWQKQRPDLTFVVWGELTGSATDSGVQAYYYQEGKIHD